MSRECYVSQPESVEVFDLRGKTDIILRKDIAQTEKQDGEYTAMVWECEELQYRKEGTVTVEKVLEEFDYYWALAEGKGEEEATDEELTKAGEPTLKERVETLEEALMELAEVIANG